MGGVYSIMSQGDHILFGALWGSSIQKCLVYKGAGTSNAHDLDHRMLKFWR